MSVPARAALPRALAALTWLALAALAVVILRTAWLSDDAYISFRAIRNFVAGDGLRWNLGERVQVFTHPLWFFVLSALHAVTGELYFTTYAASIAISLAVAGMVSLRLAPTRMTGLLCAVVLVSSRSFVDYATSGLENPLTHLLLALFGWQLTRAAPWSPRRGFDLALIAALCALTRLDTLALLAPGLAWAACHGRGGPPTSDAAGRGPWPSRGRGLGALALGFAPLVAWELFSVVYYGFPFPNTAYAKISGAIGVAERMGRGLGYLRSCLAADPLAILVVALGVIAPLARRRWALAPLSAGVALYVLYILWIGGDFMVGRFLTAPMVLAAIAAMRALPVPDRAPWLALAAIPLALSLQLGPRSPLVAGADYAQTPGWPRNLDSRQIADERAVYFKVTGLLRASGRFGPPRHEWFDEGRGLAPGSVHRSTTLGFVGWAAPRDAVVFDQLGLADAFVARLPPIANPTWRPGHLDRAVPRGYLETRQSGRMQMRNHWLAELYRELQVVTSGPLWSGERWRLIWRLNTGGVAPLVAHYADVEVDAAELAPPKPDGTPWRDPGNVVLPPGALLVVHLPAARTAARVTLAADGNDQYEIALFLGDRPGWTGIAPPVVGGQGLANRAVEVPASAGAFDRIEIRGRGGDRRYSVGHVGVEDARDQSHDQSHDQPRDQPRE